MNTDVIGFWRNLVMRTLIAFWLGAGTFLCSAGSSIPPGVPEPGLILWGNIVNTTNTSQPISITSASWSVTDGAQTSVYSQLTRPPVRTFTQGDQNYYVLEVPFDTRRFGTIQLADPATEGVNSFQLASSSPPTYTLTPTINGALATVRFIDGAPAGGGSVPVAGFNSNVRGRVIRVDLSITPVSESYDQWATRIFGSVGSPNAAPNADPDHDGLTNAGEYAAGTNPLDASSTLRLLQISVTANQATLGWQSIASKQYVIESATNVVGPWTNAASVVAQSALAQAILPRTPAGPPAYFRVRVVSP